MQRHLDLPWTPDCIHRRAQANSWIIELLADHRRSDETAILRYIIGRDVEGSGIREVENIEGVQEVALLSDRELLDERSIGALLIGLPKDISLTGREGGLEGIVWGDPAA